MTELASALRMSHFTLAASNVVTHSVVGYFSQPKETEILFVKGNGQWLQLSMLTPSSLRSICCANTFGLIRTLNKMPSRIPHQADFVAITTSAGKLIILEYDKRTECFNVITKYQISNKTGYRKGHVGQYAQCIPLKQRSTQSNEYLFFISAPFEAHLFIKLTMSSDRTHNEWTQFAQLNEANCTIFDTSFTYLLCGADDTESLYCVSLQCTICSDSKEKAKAPPLKKRKLNTDNSEMMSKTVKFYKMNLKNQEIGDVYSVRVSSTSHCLLSIPLNVGHQLFGGIVVCSANIISYIRPQTKTCQQLHCFIPKRVQHISTQSNDTQLQIYNDFDIKPHDIMINTYDLYYNDKDVLYILLQTDRGDVCKMSMFSNSTSNQFEAFSVQVLDAMPLSHCISIFPCQYIYFGSQNTDNYLCKIKWDTMSTQSATAISSSADDKALLFEANVWRHFKCVEQYPTCSNLIGIKVDDLLDEIQPQIYCLCGRAQHSTLQMLRYGLCITCLATQSLSQFKVSRVWTVSTSITQQTTNLMVVSTSKTYASTQHLTMLFQVDPHKQEIVDISPSASPFDANSDTLHFGAMYIGNANTNTNTNTNTSGNILNIAHDTALIQITSSSINFVSRNAAPYSWKPGGGQVITDAVSTARVIVITLNDEFVLLLKPQHGKLLLAGKRLELDSKIIKIAVMRTYNNAFVTRLAIATVNQHITIYEINDNGMDITNRFRIHSQLDTDSISCLCFQKFCNTDLGYLFVGTDNGYVFRFSLCCIYNVLPAYKPNVVSALHSEFVKNLGSCSVRLIPSELAIGYRCVVAISSKNYIITADTADVDDILREMKCIPLIYSYNDVLHHKNTNNRVMFDDCSSFILSTEHRLIAIDSENNNIQIYGIQSMETVFESSQFNLRYTPRDITIYKKHLIVIESDYGEYCNTKRKALLNNDEMDECKQRIIGYPRPLHRDHWSSCFRIISPSNPKDCFVEEFDENEAAFSISMCRLSLSNNIFNDYLVIGTALNMTSNKMNSANKGCIRIYNFATDPMHPTLVSSLLIAALPKYVCSYRDGLLVAFAKKIEFYRFDKNTSHGTGLMNDKRFNIEITDRIKRGNFYISKIEFDEQESPHLFVCDNLNGFHLFTYNDNRKRFDFVVSQSFLHQHVLSSALLDAQTISFTNIFGNFYISRMHKTNKQSTFNDLVQFYVGDTVTSIARTKLSPLGKPLILYGTITGTIGVFIPFASGVDADFFDALQYYLSSKLDSLSGEAYILFRSKYMPSKHCCDHDQTSCFARMSAIDKDMFQKAINIPMPKISQNISSITNCVF